MNKINSKCRTCFNSTTKGLHSLNKMTTDENKQQKSYAELLHEVTNIDILNDKSSKLPQSICGCCSRKLKAAHAFVQQAQYVNEKLYSMLIEQTDVVASKQLDCLQEIQIDIESCLEIKMEHDDMGDINVTMENEMENKDILKKNLQLKKEASDDDILIPENTLMDNIVERNTLRDSLGTNFNKSNRTDSKESNYENDDESIDEQHCNASDNNSNYDISCASGSDNDKFQTKPKISKKRHGKTESELLKNLKTANGYTTDKDNKGCEKVENDDELLPAKCIDCDKVFANSRLLNRHRRGTHVPDNLKIQCLHCEAKFSRRHNMYAHIRLIHKNDNLEDHQFQTKKISTAKQYACQECPRSYTNKYKLLAHIKSHHNPDNKPAEKVLQPKKRFLCTLCGLTFDSYTNLNIHFRRHTGEKPYKCEFCDRAYHRLYDVQVHRRSHTGEKPYQCTLCEKAFRRSNKLKIHMRTHTNERPYKCTQCEKAFKQSKDLNIHKRTHTGERPYKCDVCQSTFTQSNSLRLHQIKQKHLETSNTAEDLSGEIAFICQQTKY